MLIINNMSLRIDDDDDSDLSEIYEETDSEAEELESPDEEPELDEELKDILIVKEPEVEIGETISFEELEKTKYANGILNFKEALMRKYAEGTIDYQQYFTELLELEIFENSKVKEVPVTSEGIEIIKNIRAERLELKQKLLDGKINQDEYDDLYIKSLRDEKQTVKDFKAVVYQPAKPKFDLSTLDMEEKIEYLLKKEDQMVAKLAKKHSIKLKKPNTRLKNSTNPDTRSKYLSESEIYEKNKVYIMNKYLPGYKSKRLNPTGYTTTKYEIDTPIEIDVKTLLKREPRKKLISERDILDQEKENYLKNQLRKLPVAVLLECLADNNLLSKESSYIQRLKSNRVPILKFIKYPKDQEELNKIVGEELIDKYVVSRELVDSGYFTKTAADNSIDSNEVLCISGKRLAIKVPFKGVNREYVGKVVENVLQKGVQGEDLSAIAESFDPVFRIPDPLYVKIAEAGDLENKVAFVYQLYTPVPGFDKEGVYVISRYTNFEEYLRDLKGILAANLLKLENNGSDKYSISVLQTKINKINYYLENNEDIDLLNLADVRETKRIELVSEAIDQARSSGRSELNNFILSINSSSLPKSQTLEDSIYFASVESIQDNGETITTFNRGMYKYLIIKVIFILTQYPDMLEDFLNGEILPDTIINFETPYVNMEDFTKESEFKALSGEDKLKKLLEWSPENELYLKYKTYIDRVNQSTIEITKFDKLVDELKKDSITLDYLEINKIFQEEYEVKFWEKAKQEINNVTIAPRTYTLELWKFRQLNKKRYTLPSLRIYRVATIRERVELKEQLIQLFINCNIIDYKSVAYIVENIIYSKSKYPGDYKKYSKMIIENYKKFCDYLNELFQDKVNIINYIPIITEYFYKDGESLTMNKEKVSRIVEAFNSDSNIENILKELSENELKLYHSSILHTISPSVKRRFTLLKTLSKLLSIYNESSIKLYNEKSMIYVKPHIELQRPDTEDYIFLNGKYITGGNFPSFKDTKFNRRNYSTNDLQELMELFDIEYSDFLPPTSDENIEDNDFRNYLKIMNKISELTRAKEVKLTIEKPQKEIDFKVYTEPTVTIQYTLRPRMGVPNPGEVYYTSKDYIKEYQKEYPTNRDYYEREYGVPYKYENFIPVYHIKLKELVESKLIMIEGPAIFRSPEEDPDATYSTSPYHIFIEYKDTYGKIVYFREGVSPKKVLTAKKESLDTCTRFKNEKDCNDPNSYSIDARKCFWDSKKCVSSFFTDKVVTSKDVWEYIPSQEELKLPWSQALLTAKTYIKDISEKENLGEIGIAKLIADQSRQLYNYRLELEKNYVPRPKIDSKPDESVLELIKELEVKPKEIVSKIPNNFKMINIKTVVTELKSRPLTSRELQRFKTFELPDIGLVEINTIEKQNVKVTTKSKESIDLPLSQFIVSDTIPTIYIKNIFVYISEDDYKYLQNPPSVFSWNLKKLDFDIEQYLEEELEYKTENVNYIDTSIIVPTGMIGTTPVVTREDIDKAMIKLAFSEYSLIDDRLQLDTKINATEDAIRRALEENLSLLSDDFKLIVREITVEDIIKVIESKQPEVITLEESLNKELNNAIKNSDKRDIEKVLKKFEKLEMKPEDRKAAELKLEEIEERIGYQKRKIGQSVSGLVQPEPTYTDIPIEPKKKEDKSSIVKGFKSRSVISSRRGI